MARRARKNQEVTLGRRQRRRKEQRRKNVKEVIGTILYLVILCAIVYFILHYVGQRTVVRGDSMDTTLSDGQNLIMDKLSYRFHEPERYDIVRKNLVRMIIFVWEITVLSVMTAAMRRSVRYTVHKLLVRYG